MMEGSGPYDGDTIGGRARADRDHDIPYPILYLFREEIAGGPSEAVRWGRTVVGNILGNMKSDFLDQDHNTHGAIPREKISLPQVFDGLLEQNRKNSFGRDGRAKEDLPGSWAQKPRGRCS